MERLKFAYIAPKDLRATDSISDLSKEAGEALLNSIAIYGILSPIVVSSLDGKTVIEGRQRLKAALRLNLEEVPAVFVEVENPTEITGLAVMLNSIRGEPLVYDIGTHLKQALDGGFRKDLLPFSDSEIAELIGISSMSWDQYNSMGISPNKATSKLFDL